MKKDEKKALVDFFNEVSDEYTEAKKKVREAGLEIIKAAVKKHEGQLSLTEIYEENGHEEVVSVTYDGGNHPEYAFKTGIAVNKRIFFSPRAKNRFVKVALFL